MVLVYYRRKDGTIRHYHQYPADKGLDAAQDAAKQYNILHGVEDTAYVVEYEDNSIEAYLYRKAVEKKIHDKETVRDLISALEEALDTARYLED